MNISFWERDSFLMNGDAIIIGAGIVGLSAAYHWKKKNPKHRVIILERDWLSDGASSKNAGFACFGSISELQEDLESMSEQEIVALSIRRYNGLLELRQLLGDEHIQFKSCGGSEVFFNEISYFENAEFVNKWNALFKNAIGPNVYSARPTSAYHGMKKVFGVIENAFEGSIHTGLMLQSFRKLVTSVGVELYHGVHVNSFEENLQQVTLNSSVGTWNANRLIITTNAFASELIPLIDVQPKRNQVIVSKPLEHNLISTYHVDKGYIYFRAIQNRILIGGMRHLYPNTENTSERANTNEVVLALKEFASDKILNGRDFEIDMQWSGIIATGNKKQPIVQRQSDCVGVAVRMGGMGVAIGTSVGMEITELMLQ
jgi:gamma-glutamylputrescine oxidase